MLTGIFGRLGSGKSLFLTILAKNNPQIHFVSNIALKLPNYEQLNQFTFIKGQYENCVIFIDESYTSFDSRLSMSNKNRLMSYTLMQSRKKNVEIFFIAQLKGMADLRYREMMDFCIDCQREGKDFLYYRYAPSRPYEGSHILLEFEKAEPYFQYYDTNEIIDIDKTDAIEFMTHEELNLYIDRIVEDIQDSYEMDFPNGKKKLKRAYVSNWLLVHQKDKKLEKYVWNRIQAT